MKALFTTCFLLFVCCADSVRAQTPKPTLLTEENSQRALATFCPQRATETHTYQGFRTHAAIVRVAPRLRFITPVLVYHFLVASAYPTIVLCDLW